MAYHRGTSSKAGRWLPPIFTAFQPRGGPCRPGDKNVYTRHPLPLPQGRSPDPYAVLCFLAWAEQAWSGGPALDWDACAQPRISGELPVIAKVVHHWSFCNGASVSVTVFATSPPHSNTKQCKLTIALTVCPFFIQLLKLTPIPPRSIPIGSYLLLFPAPYLTKSDDLVATSREPRWRK